MKITYCKGWFRAKRVATQFLEESQARMAYDRRELYTVLVGDPDHPHCFIESNMDYIGVEFLDERLRNDVAYQFVEKEPGRLFLQMIVVRTYVDEYSSDVRAGTVYFINPGGDVRIDYDDLIQQRKSTHQLRIDPGPYWAPYPQFGKYVELVQERPIPTFPVTEIEDESERD